MLAHFTHYRRPAPTPTLATENNNSSKRLPGADLASIPTS